MDSPGPRIFGRTLGMIEKGVNGMKILYVTSEAVPFCKTGGLADVAGSLPPALAEQDRKSVV